MAATPPPRPSRVEVIATATVLALPFVLVGVGVGWLWTPAAGLVAAGLLIFHDTRRVGASKDGKS